MKLIADLHTHTTASGHAKASLPQMVARAKELGHRAIAITDHSVAMPGAANPWFYHDMPSLPNLWDDGFLLLKGIEANVVHPTGAMDLSQEMLEQFDWVIASLHVSCIWPITPQQVTQAWLGIAENPVVDMIGHAETKEFMFDYDLVTKAFAHHNKVVELNAGSALSRPGNEDNLRRLAQSCMQNGVYIAITTDAHTTEEMGSEEKVLQMVEEIGYPQERIINSSMQGLRDALARRGKRNVAALFEQIRMAE